MVKTILNSSILTSSRVLSSSKDDMTTRKTKIMFTVLYLVLKPPHFKSFYFSLTLHFSEKNIG